MNNLAFVLWYTQRCFDGRLASSDCGPIWHISVIVAFLLAAILALVVLRLRAQGREA
jgi:hypothetical protein